MAQEKQPSEAITFDYDFTDALGEGATVQSITAVSFIARGNGSALVNQGQAVDGLHALVRWAGGTDGETYSTTVRVLDSDGDSHELDGEIVVIDRKFTVPVIPAAPYLSADEYVARFGKEETVRVTDESRTGNVDAGKLAAALVDATEFAQAYIKRRYTLPLPSVPSILKGIVADLARERLHKMRPSQAVKDNADLARSNLRDISAGRMELPVAVGDQDPVESTGDDYAMTAPSLPGRVFDACSLARF